MKRWQKMKLFIEECQKRGWDSFTSNDVGLAFAVDSKEAGLLIQAGMEKHRTDKTGTFPSFYRELGKRTSSAVYTIGNGPRDISSVAHSLADDTLCKYERTTRRDIEAMMRGNPEALRKRKAALEAIALHVQAFALSLDSI